MQTRRHSSRQFSTQVDHIFCSVLSNVSLLEGIFFFFLELAILYMSAHRRWSFYLNFNQISSKQDANKCAFPSTTASLTSNKAKTGVENMIAICHIFAIFFFQMSRVSTQNRWMETRLLKCTIRLLLHVTIHTSWQIRNSWDSDVDAWLSAEHCCQVEAASL